MILEEVLHARAKRVEFEYVSIVLLNACCAPDVMLIFSQHSHEQDTQEIKRTTN